MPLHHTSFNDCSFINCFSCLVGKRLFLVGETTKEVLEENDTKSLLNAVSFKVSLYHEYLIQEAEADHKWFMRWHIKPMPSSFPTTFLIHLDLFLSFVFLFVTMLCIWLVASGKSLLFPNSVINLSNVTNFRIQSSHSWKSSECWTQSQLDSSSHTLLTIATIQFFWEGKGKVRLRFIPKYKE